MTQKVNITKIGIITYTIVLCFTVLAFTVNVHAIDEVLHKDITLPSSKALVRISLEAGSNDVSRIQNTSQSSSIQKVRPFTERESKERDNKGISEFHKEAAIGSVLLSISLLSSGIEVVEVEDKENVRQKNQSSSDLKEDDEDMQKVTKIITSGKIQDINYEALKYLEMGNFKAAKKLYEAAMDMDSENSYILGRYGITLLNTDNKDDWDRGGKCLFKAAKMGDYRAVTFLSELNEKIMEYVSKNMEKEAIQLIQEARSKKDPSDIWLLNY